MKKYTAAFPEDEPSYLILYPQFPYMLPTGEYGHPDTTRPALPFIAKHSDFFPTQEPDDYAWKLRN